MNQETAGEKFQQLVAIMARVRAPGGCPWDRQQTFDSIKPFTLEETFEVLDAIDHRDWGELGQFLGEFPPIAVDDGVQHLIGFLEGEGLDAVEGLFPVPRAAARGAQAGHDRDQLLKLLAGSFWIHFVWGSDFPSM